MEAVPRLPMVHFDLKITADRPPVSFSPLKQYIREFYDEDPAAYSGEIRNLEALRTAAIRPVKDVTGCHVLKKYYCQLHFLQSRFPMAREGSAAVEFTWKDTYSGSTTTAADVKLEMVSILYNIGALHSQLGSGEDRCNPDGLKMACTHFQCAAWAFQHLKDTYPQPPGSDLSPDVMLFKYHFSLAQAQECILEKSMTDNRKATINAKVASQIVDYYNLALNTMLQPPSDILSDGVIIDVVGSRPFKTWKKYIRFKIAYYNCVSLLYQGMQSEEQQKMGERVAYYQGALDKLNEAIKLSKGIDKSDAVMESLIFTRDVVEGKRKAAKNENEFIYHEEIPDLDSLPHVKGASLVKGIPFNVNDVDISGPDIFVRLVPMKAHEASSMYSEEKAKLLRKISGLIDVKDEEVVSFMSCLQLEYLKAHADTLGLPQEVVDRCAALSVKPDAIPNLISAMDKLSDAYHEVDGMLKEIMELIKEEEIAEKEYQEIVGPRPPSIVATDLTREANKYMEAHKKAAESNETLHRAMTQHIENLRVLQQPLSEVQVNLPNLESLNLESDSTLQEVIKLVDKVGEMRRQRATLASQLRESICSDDITGILVTRVNEKIEDTFTKELEKHDKYVTLIEQNLAAQDNILRALTEAYANYAPTRKATTEIMRQRDLMLSALISSYDAYEDLIAKSTKGQEFYRKLETNLTKLLQRVKGTCKVQQEERETILAQNMKKAQQIAEGGIVAVDSSSSKGGLKLRDYLQNRKTASASPSHGSPYFHPNSTGIESQTWLPAVRPAPVGSEGTTPVSVCVGSTKPEATPTFDSQPSSLNSYSPQTSPAYNFNSAAKYPDTQGYYYNSLYSTNPTLSSLQYPTMPETSSTGQPVSSAQYTNPSYSQQTSNAVSSEVSDQYSLSANVNQPVGSQSTLGYVQQSDNAVGYQYSQQPQPMYSTSINPSQTQNYNAYYTASGPTNVGTSTYTPNYNAHQQGYQYYPNQDLGQSSYSAWQQTQINQLAQQQTQMNHLPQQQTQMNQLPQQQTQMSQLPQQQTQMNQLPQQQTQINQLPQQQTQINQLPQQQTQINQFSQQQAQPQNPHGQIPTSLATTVQYTTSMSSLATQSTTNAGTHWPMQNGAANWATSGSAYTPSSNWQVDGTTATSSSWTANNSSNAWQHPTINGSSWQQDHNYSVSYDSQNAATSQENPQGYQSYDYSTVYPTPQFQETPGTQTSYYSSAGIGKGQMSSTMSPVGTTPYPSGFQTADSNVDSPQNYYVHPYGGQYGTQVGTSTELPSSGSQQNLTKHNSVTYMQASNGGKGPTMTYSQQTNEKPASNVDLLAGLDFAVTDAPLLPQPKIDKSVEESKEKLSNLSLIDSTGSTSATTAESDKMVAPAKMTEIERPPPSRTPMKDPFADKDLLELVIQEVEKFEKFVEGLNSKTLNGPTTLDMKWNELQDLQEKDSHKLIISVARCYPMKNRFADILPYDLTRVELPSTKDDYINASYAKGLGVGCPNLIMTQAPLKATFADFWTMVLEQHVELVVCLLAESQVGGEVYWPANKGADFISGKIKVSLQSCNARTHWVERIVTVSDSKTSRVVIHLEFVSWPNSWLPESPKPLLSLVDETFNVWSQQRGKGPVVVHCDAGVGRSGVFVVMTQCLAELKLLGHLPDVIALTATLAKCRKNPLKDRQYLQFTYQCLLYYAQDLLMKRGILTSRSTFEEKRSKSKSHTRHPSEDFLLNSFKDLSERRTSDASNSSSSGKLVDADPLSQIDALWPIKRYS